MALARLCDGRITAVDIHQPVLDTLQRRAEGAGVAERVVPLNMSMAELDFPDGTFDVIWCEGAIFIMGFRAGLTAWRPLLRPGGWLVISEAVWFCDEPPAEVKAFWDACYPAITHPQSNVRMAEEAGYAAIGTFRLPTESWFEFYRTLAPKLVTLRRKYTGDDAALSQIAECEREIEVFHKYSDTYGYQFFVLRKA
jgi:SAM-dependent methyltransferase